MFPFKAFLFLITICVAKSEVDYETLCKNDYKDEKNNQIDVLKYCSNKLCLEKCCGPTEMLRLNGTCINKTKLFKRFTRNKMFSNAEAKFNSINILSSMDVNKKLKNEVVFVKNRRNFQDCTAERPEAEDYEISEDGSLRWQDSLSKKWKTIEKLNYCIDYKLVQKPDKKLDIKIIIRQITMDPQETKKIETFEIVALLISTFFLLLVLAVYCLLPDLRNLTGLILMAYTFSLLFAFVNKLILTFVKRVPPEGFCKKYSPVVYFAFMSSIFWLSAISYEVWWGIRSFRYHRSSKRSERLKFMWYGLYAWGTPLLITAIVTILDNIVYLDLSVEPPFKDCLINGPSFDYYFKIPIGILIFINIVMFFMTVYNIWMVKHGVNKCQDSRSTKQQDNKFSTYAKLSVMMGLSWCLELLPAIDKLWFYILTNLYNLLIGVAIFYWFICKKTILVQLCRKFNIRNEFTKKFESQLSQYNKSGITRSTRTASSIVKNKPQNQTQENMDLLENCPKEENPIV